MWVLSKQVGTYVGYFISHRVAEETYLPWSKKVDTMWFSGVPWTDTAWDRHTAQWRSITTRSSFRVETTIVFIRLTWDSKRLRRIASNPDVSMTSLWDLSLELLVLNSAVLAIYSACLFQASSVGLSWQLIVCSHVYNSFWGISSSCPHHYHSNQPDDITWRQRWSLIRQVSPSIVST